MILGAFGIFAEFRLDLRMGEQAGSKAEGDDKAVKGSIHKLWIGGSLMKGERPRSLTSRIGQLAG